MIFMRLVFMIDADDLDALPKIRGMILPCAESDAGQPFYRRSNAPMLQRGDPA
jgi:hypothetical protein